MTQAEVNHLRRLLGWVSCDIGQTPEEFEDLLRKLAPTIGRVDEAGRARLGLAYQRSTDVPKYIRAAVKALQKIVAQDEGEIIDANQQSAIGEQT